MLLAAVMLTGCTASVDDAQTDTSSSSASSQSIDDVSITDNTALYEDDPYAVTTMYLTVRTGNEADGTNHTWDEVNAHSTYYYDENGIDRYKVEGLLQVGDDSGPVSGQLGYGDTAPNATVQIRGKTTSRAAQKSYQIKIKDGKGSWNDQTTIILNKHIFDGLRFRNKLVYDLMGKDPDLIGARTTFVHLYVKDLTKGADGEFSDYGLYTQVEQINKRYLRTHGLDDNGQLYKASMFEFYTYADTLKLTTDPTYDKSAFEDILEIKGSDDHSKLIAMLDDLNNYSIPIEDTFAKYFDEQNFLSWLAFQLVIGNTDITTQNFYLYSPQNGNKWYFISWDNDGAFMYDERQAKTYGSGYNYTDGVSNLWGNILYRRVLKSDTLRQKLIDRVNYYHDQLAAENLSALFDGYSSVVLKYLYNMPDIQYASVKQENYSASMAAALDDLDTNYAMIMESLNHPMPYFCATPQYSGENILFSWDDSYDFGGGDITYMVEIATDYNFENVIFRKSGLTVPQTECGSLADGQYFLRVTATNSSGQSQTLMYYYTDINSLKHYGVYSFFVSGQEIIGDYDG